MLNIITVAASDTVEKKRYSSTEKWLAKTTGIKESNSPKGGFRKKKGALKPREWDISLGRFEVGSVEKMPCVIPPEEAAYEYYKDSLIKVAEGASKAIDETMKILKSMEIYPAIAKHVNCRCEALKETWYEFLARNTRGIQR